MAKKRDSSNLRGRHAEMEITSYAKKHNVGKLMMRAGESDVYVVDSEMKGIGYAYEDGYMAIVCPGGYIKMPIDTMRIMVTELDGIIGDVEDLRRMWAQV